MPLCGSGLQGQSLEKVDCHYVCSVVSAVQSPLQQGAQPLLYGHRNSGAFLPKTYINAAAIYAAWVIVALLKVFDKLLFCCLPFCRRSICGMLPFPAVGFIADENVSTLLRVWVHPPAPQIALLWLQRFQPLGALGMKPRLRYWSDSEALNLGYTIWCPSSNRDELLFLD